MTIEKKATFKRAIRNSNPFDKHAWEHTDLLYEYRGHEYIVTKHNNGYSGDPLWKQHQEEQARIDAMIDNPMPTKKEWQYEGSAQEGFDLFWEYVTEHDL